MAKKQSEARLPKEPSYTIGRAAFARISLVEGITPSDDARRRTEEFDRKGLSPEERRQAIIEAYRKRD